MEDRVTIACTLTPDLCVVADPPLRTEGKNALYSTARKLDAMGHGAAYLQAHDERGGKTLCVGPIAVAAKWTVSEHEGSGPRITRWKPFPGERYRPPARVEASDVPAPPPAASDENSEVLEYREAGAA